MIEKDPSFFAEIMSAIRQAWPQVSGIVLAVALCYGRLIYDTGERRAHWWIEPILCGLITWAATAGITLIMEVWLPNSAVSPESLAPFIGGVVGLLGVKKIRALALKKMGVSDEIK